jgi:hypothetical protein
MTLAEQRLNEWEIKINQWKASQKSITTWCKEQSIPEHRFYYWQRKLKKTSQKAFTDNSSFVQLADSSEGVSGIELKIQKFTINLSREFDTVTLKRCLQLLQEVSC